MRVSEAWTLVWAQSGNLVPALDDGADGMIFLTRAAAEAEAIRQTDLYADQGAGESIRAEPMSLDSATAYASRYARARAATSSSPPRK